MAIKTTYGKSHVVMGKVTPQDVNSGEHVVQLSTKLPPKLYFSVNENFTVLNINMGHFYPSLHKASTIIIF